VTLTEAAVEPDQARPRPLFWRRRPVLMGLWAVLFAAGCLLVGLPTDPAYAFVWCWAATIAWNPDRPWRAHLRFARDWLPVVLLLVLYNLSRGYADDGATPHAAELVHADTTLLGWATGGQTPTVWLQQHFYDPAHLHWWDAAASIVYFSHFVTTPTIAVVLWLRDRPRWVGFMRRWIALSAAGLATYFLYPAAPPWLAAKNHVLAEPVARISTDGWTALGLHSAGNTLNALQADQSNPVAAMPSLHTAYAMMAVAFFLPMVRRRWWPLLLAYPLAMTFTLVYTGEHYVADVLVGWLYVALTFVAVGLGERWWARRRALSSRGD